MLRRATRMRFLARFISSDAKNVLGNAELKLARTFWDRVATENKQSTAVGENPKLLIQLQVTDPQTICLHNMTCESDTLKLPLLSRWSFPRSERVLLEAGAPRYLLRLSGHALDTEPNACALIVDRRPEQLQKLVNRARIPRNEGIQCLFVLRVDKTRDEWCEIAANFLLRTYTELMAAPVNINLSHRLDAIRALQKQVPEFAQRSHFVCCIEREEDGPSLSWTLTLPGGKRLLAESTVDCALRELHEETGLHPLRDRLEQSVLTCLRFDRRMSGVVLNPCHFDFNRT